MKKFFTRYRKMSLVEGISVERIRFADWEGGFSPAKPFDQVKNQL